MQRVEDPLLLTGQAEFTDNLQFPGMLYCAFVRSPHAHARIARIDTTQAEQLPGVVAVITGEEVSRLTDLLPGVPPGFSGYSLAVDKARFAGEPVAAVAATSRYLAEDAADLIKVEYEPLEPVVDALEGLKEGAPLVYEAQGTNVILQRVFTFGDVDAAFAEAALVVSDRYRFPRVSANPMETNGFIVAWNPLTDELTSWGNFQSPHHVLPAICGMLRLPSNRIRLNCQPSGGSFGSKNNAIRYFGAIAHLSKKCGGRPVKWIEDRYENLTATAADAWERYYEGSLAFNAEGVATAFRTRCIDDLGSLSQYPGMAVKPLSQFTGCYAIPACQYDVTVVATNKNPQGAYRGYGPPPNNILLEWLMDQGARKLGLDPAEIRRRNFIRPEQFPYTIPTGNVFDSGDYGASLDALLNLAGYEGLKKARDEARMDGRLVGLGLVTTVEVGVPNTGAMFSVITGWEGGTSTPEGAVVRVDSFGNVVAEVGFSWGGSGQHTFATYLLADYFGVDPKQVTVRTVDSQASPPGDGPIGSRQAVTLSGAILGAADRVREKLVKVAAGLLEANAADVELRDGMLSVRGAPSRSLPLAQVAWTMIHRSDLLPPDVDGSPEATYVWNAPGMEPVTPDGKSRMYLTAANAAHLVQVEVEPETGQVKILGYWIADDCGTRLNPMAVEGQIQGALAQGIGASLLEEYVYDKQGQRLTSTWMDYLLPTMMDVPDVEKVALTTPSPVTPLGAKGAGEGAIHTTPAALYCAVNDALIPLGIRLDQLPMTPTRVWHAARAAGATARPESPRS